MGVCVVRRRGAALLVNRSSQFSSARKELINAANGSRKATDVDSRGSLLLLSGGSADGSAARATRTSAHWKASMSCFCDFAEPPRCLLFCQRQQTVISILINLYIFGRGGGLLEPLCKFGGCVDCIHCARLMDSNYLLSTERTCYCVQTAGGRFTLFFFCQPTPV